MDKTTKAFELLIFFNVFILPALILIFYVANLDFIQKIALLFFYVSFLGIAFYLTLNATH